MEVMSDSSKTFPANHASSKRLHISLPDTERLVLLDCSGYIYIEYGSDLASVFGKRYSFDDRKMNWDWAYNAGVLFIKSSRHKERIRKTFTNCIGTFQQRAIVLIMLERSICCSPKEDKEDEE